MGNCIFLQHLPVVVKKKKWKICRVDEKMNSSLSSLLKGKLLMSEKLSSPDVWKQLVKIVVDKRHWKWIMGGVDEMQLRRMMLHTLVRRSKRWRPSLAVILKL